MAPREFSAGFITFINRYITSVEQIEVLLHLHADAQRSWTPTEMASLLRSNENSVVSRLEALRRDGFADGDPKNGYRYAASGNAREMIAMLAAEYATRRFRVIELVFSRASAARSFADAFRLREESDEDNG